MDHCFPGERRVEEDGLSSSLEAPSCIYLDMRHLKDSVKIKKQQSPTASAEVQSSLKQEISLLEKRLQYRFEVRRALEIALGYRTSSRYDPAVPISKPSMELVKEIAVLELEVVYLERYLLSLYRRAFEQQVSSLPYSKRDERFKTPVDKPKTRFSEVSGPDNESKVENSAILSGNHENWWEEEEPNGTGEEKLMDSSVHPRQSSLSRRAIFLGRTSPDEILSKTERSCHSQPLSVTQYAQNAPSIISLADHLGTRISDHVPKTPNKLSEDMIKCVPDIYCKLADPLLVQNSFSSPNSPTSSANAFSPQDQHQMWSPGFRNNSSFDVRLDNPFHVEGLKEFSGPYSTMVEVPWIFRYNQKLDDVELLLQNFRSFLCQLEEVDPRKLKHEEKLAFWINIHNSLVMHVSVLINEKTTVIALTANAM
ncbi:G2484-1 protein [Hibiscus syriacus]|uniref:G2484-1 protein n=1 Tax=Hibiscus syriacus TaxID=106335 RepID=A0A6A2WMY0_HIBSY|nr:G2484-1 protein [Hibiscus syriacus]